MKFHDSPSLPSVNAVFHHGTGGVSFSGISPRLISRIFHRRFFGGRLQLSGKEGKMKPALRLTIAVVGLAVFYASSVMVQSQFCYETKNGTITITGYTCPGDAVVNIPESINALPVTSIGAWAFSGCTGLASVTIPSSVTDIGYSCTGCCGDLMITQCYGPFSYCTGLEGVFFEGNVPTVDYSAIHGDGSNNATVFYLPGTTGWGGFFAGRPTALWVRPNPTILATASSLGIKTNGFGLTVSWATNASIVVEAATSLANPVWSPVVTNALTDGIFHFNDPDWRNHPSRFYRIRSQ
jgi:hypothetical protein